MNSLIEDKQIPNNETHQQLTNSSKGKLLNKAFSFFIFYKILNVNDKKLSTLEKISFRLKQDKITSSDKYLQTTSVKNQKVVNLIFTNIDNQNQLQNSFLDLKFHIVQNKTKIIFLGYQSELLKLIDKTSQFGIDIKQVPFAIYSPEMNNDLSQFLGWRLQNLGCLAEKNPSDLSNIADQWISSPCQKIDVWQIHIKVKQGGKMSKLVYDNTNKSYLLKQLQKTMERKQYFVSNFSIGYHSKMFMQFESSKKVQESSFLDRFKFGLQGFKRFCCVGNQSMKSSTGIVNISFKDEKNGEMQIMKQFYDQQNVEGEFIQQKKYRQNRKVLSIVLSNIDSYYGQKLDSSRMNDNKLQLISFESQNEHHKIGSIGGQIKLKFETDEQICMKIGDSSILVEKPQIAIIKPYMKLKAMISKTNVKC